MSISSSRMLLDKASSRCHMAKGGHKTCSRNVPKLFTCVQDTAHWIVPLLSRPSCITLTRFLQSRAMLDDYSHLTCDQPSVCAYTTHLHLPLSAQISVLLSVYTAMYSQQMRHLDVGMTHKDIQSMGHENITDCLELVIQRNVTNRLPM